MRNSEKFLNKVANEYKDSYVLFDLNSRANKIKSCYLIKNCITALAQFIDNKKTNFLGA